MSREKPVAAMARPWRSLPRPTLWFTLALFGLAAAVWAWDVPIQKWLRSEYLARSDVGLREALEVVKTFGKTQCILLLSVCVGLAGFRRRGAEMLIALVLATMMVLPIKVVTGRERPRGHDFYSFPSGDSVTVGTVTFALANASPIGLALAVPLAGGVCLGRILVNAHYPSDVLVGLGLGLLAGAWAPVVRRRLLRRRLRHRDFEWAAIGCALILAVVSMVTQPNKEIHLFLVNFWPALLLVGVLRYLRRWSVTRNE